LDDRLAPDDRAASHYSHVFAQSADSRPAF
jgi:hypothetical protein